MKVIEKMSGRKIIRAETSGDRFAEKQVKAHKDRLEELVVKALSHLVVDGFFAGKEDITQIGVTGFHWKPPGKFIPVFEPWREATIAENRRIFNAHT